MKIILNAAKSWVRAIGIAALFGCLVACGGGGGSSGEGGGGGGGGGGSLSLTLAPSKVTATLNEGERHHFIEVATVRGQVDGTVYVVIVDEGEVLSSDILIYQTSDVTFEASLSTRLPLAGGRHTGAFQVRLCGDPSCEREYARVPLPYDFNVIPGAVARSLTPASVTAGSDGFTLTIDGDHFDRSSKLLWNGYERATTYISQTRLTAQIPSSDLSIAQTVSVSVAGTNGIVLGSLPFAVLPVQLTAISPDSWITGAGGFTLKVTGQNFTPQSSVQLNAISRPTTFVSSTQLTTVLSDADATQPGDMPVRVSNGHGGFTGAYSNELSIRFTPPELSSLSPTSAAVGSDTVTLNVIGTRLLPNAVVRFNGIALPTQYLSATQLRAQLDSEYLVQRGTKQITVSNGESASSLPLSFTVVGPELSALSPDTVIAGSPGLTLTLIGSGFSPASVVLWNTQPRPTTYVSESWITAEIPASDLSDAAVFPVQVTSGEFIYTERANFTVANAAPTLTSVSPAAVATGGPSFTLSVNGGGFVSSSVVRWNGSDRATVYVSPSRLTAQITQEDISHGGSYRVTVFSPAPGGGSTTSLPVAVDNPKPVIGALNSPTAATGCPGFKLFVVGNGFVPESSVLWDGVPRDTAFVSQGVLSVQIATSELAVPGSVPVTVSSPAPGGGVSAAATFTVSTSGPPTTDATSMWVNPAHTGVATTSCPLDLPDRSAWTVDLNATLSHPLSAAGRVYVKAGPALYALAPETGETQWGPVNAQGAGLSYDDGLLFQVQESGSLGVLQAYDAATGALQWSANLQGQYSFSNSGTTAFAGRVHTTGAGTGGTLYTLRASDGLLLWTASVDGGGSTPAVTDSGVYTSYSCNAYGNDPVAGVRLWRRYRGCAGGGGASPVASASLLFAPAGSGAYSGEILESGTGAVRSTYSATTPPAVSGDVGYFLQNVAEVNTLYAIKLSTGAILWTATGDRQLRSSPVLVNRTLFIGSASGRLFAIDADAGKTLWSADVGGAIGSGHIFGSGVAPTMTAGGNLLLVPSGNKLTAYRIATER